MTIMKRKYITPCQFATRLLSENIISASRYINSAGGNVNDIHYGGTDENGTINPDVKIHTNIWDDEW